MVDEGTISELTTIFQNYALTLDQKLSEIEVLWKRLQQQWTATNSEDLYKAVHSLNGSSGTYCFDALHREADLLEILLLEVSSADELTTQKDNITQHINAMRKSVTNVSHEKILKKFIKQMTKSMGEKR